MNNSIIENVDSLDERLEQAKSVKAGVNLSSTDKLN